MAKIKVEEEDQSVVNQTLDIDMLDKILNDDTINLETMDIGVIYNDRLRTSNTTNTLNKKDIYNMNNDLNQTINTKPNSSVDNQFTSTNDIMLPNYYQQVVFDQKKLSM